MILIGMNGGLQQGKSTVGAELRRLAGVDAKADLEFAYPISSVASAWAKEWPANVLDSGLTTLEIANKLIPLIEEPVAEVAGLTVDTSKLLIENTPVSLEQSNRLISYLQKYIEAGEARSEEFPLPVTADNKILHRALLQWIGARLIDEVDAGQDQDVWTTVIEKRIKTLESRGYSLVTVGGARYPLHQEMIHRNGGLMLQVIRPGMPVDNDVTEQAEARKLADIIVENNGTLEELNAVVRALYNDLLDGNPKSKYTAA